MLLLMASVVFLMLFIASLIGVGLEMVTTGDRITAAMWFLPMMVGLGGITLIEAIEERRGRPMATSRSLTVLPWIQVWRKLTA